MNLFRLTTRLAAYLRLSFCCGPLPRCPRKPTRRMKSALPRSSLPNEAYERFRFSGSHPAPKFCRISAKANPGSSIANTYKIKASRMLATPLVQIDFVQKQGSPRRKLNASGIESLPARNRTSTPIPMNRFLVQMAKDRKPGTALDVGMGQGVETPSGSLNRDGTSPALIRPKKQAELGTSKRLQKAGVRIKTEIKGTEDFDYGDREWDPDSV